jgi:hypothetical protein
MKTVIRSTTRILILIVRRQAPRADTTKFLLLDEAGLPNVTVACTLVKGVTCIALPHHHIHDLLASDL